jgi:N-acyl-D-amino-acid deacylase
MVYDIVIKDGFIFDGTGAPRVRGDIGITEGHVSAIGRVDSKNAKKSN